MTQPADIPVNAEAMHDRVGPAPLDRPFFVQWGWSENGDWPDGGTDERFATLDEAKAYFSGIKDDPAKPVWVGEVGDFLTPAGNPIRDWIYFLWNGPAEKRSWGPSPGRGQGYPYGTWTRRLVSYRPYRD